MSLRPDLFHLSLERPEPGSLLSPGAGLMPGTEAVCLVTTGRRFTPQVQASIRLATSARVGGTKVPVPLRQDLCRLSADLTQFRIGFDLPASGTYRVVVKLDDCHVTNSPLEFYVKDPENEKSLTKIDKKVPQSDAPSEEEEIIAENNDIGTTQPKAEGTSPSLESETFFLTPEHSVVLEPSLELEESHDMMEEQRKEAAREQASVKNYRSRQDSEEAKKHEKAEEQARWQEAEDESEGQVAEDMAERRKAEEAQMQKVEDESQKKAQEEAPLKGEAAAGRGERVADLRKERAAVAAAGLIITLGLVDAELERLGRDQPDTEGDTEEDIGKKDSEATSISLSEGDAGVVIGPGGKKVRFICRELRVKIHIEEATTDGRRKLVIQGDKEARGKAEKLIGELVGGINNSEVQLNPSCLGGRPARLLSIPTSREKAGNPDRSLAGPIGMCVLENGNIVVASTYDDRVKMFDPSGRFLKLVMPAEGEAFQRPSDMVRLRSGQFVVRDNNKLRLFSSQGAFLAPVWGDAYASKCFGLAEDGRGRLVAVHRSRDTSESLLFFDIQMDTVVKRICLADIVTDTSNSKCRFLTFHAGRLYISDLGLNHVYVIDSDTDKVILQFGKSGTGPGCLDNPAGLVVDPEGRVVVADSKNHRLCAFSPSGKFLGTPRLPEVRRPSGLLLLAGSRDLFVLNLGGQHALVKYSLTD